MRDDTHGDNKWTQDTYTHVVTLNGIVMNQDHMIWIMR